MLARIFCLFLLLGAALLPSGCASVDESADDQMIGSQRMAQA
jgi:hypothetical protein